MKQWERSPIYPNVFIVTKWRNRQMNEQKDQDTIRKLLPTWRQFCLNMHDALRKSAEFVCTPFTWFMDQVNGTADWKAMEARLDAEARKKALKTA